LINWLFGWLVEGFVGGMINLFGWLVDRLVDRLPDWSIGLLINCLVVRSFVG
jgi:hypothetical protein